MKKFRKLIIGVIVGTLMLGMTAMAAEEKPYQVTPTSAVGYTNANTVVVADAMPTGTVILTAEQCPDAIGIVITGITNTGYWEVDLGQPQKFYIAGPFLDNVTLVGQTDTGANGNSGSVANSGTTSNAVQNNGTGTTTTAPTTNTTANVATATAGEEACIQWLIAKYGTINVDECRWFYREYMRLYEQCKANPKTYVKYYSEPYTYVPNNMGGVISCYLDDMYSKYNFAFDAIYKNGTSKLYVMRTESMADKGVYFE